MEILDKYICSIKGELDSARKYAEKYVYYKNSNQSWAKMYHDMSMQELQHATNLRDIGNDEYAAIQEVYLSQKDRDCWQSCLGKFTDKSAVIRVMLGM